MKRFIYSIAKPFANLLGRHPKWIISLLYYRNFKRKINLKAPRLFHDKIMFMSLNTDTKEWSRLADKYAVREYVKEKVGEGILTKLYGVYQTPDEIDFDSLPNQFVLKTNNGCTSNIIVKDKSTLDVNKVKNKLDYWLKLPYGELSGQPHYARILPKLIIAEELLIQPEASNDGLIDYKFNCFDGVPISCAAFSERKEGTHSVSRMLYDMDWNAHPEWYDSTKEFERREIKCPVNFNEMRECARELSKGFPYVRVDLYSIEGKTYFGELTFTPGFDAFYSIEYQEFLGSLLELPEEI